MLKVNVLGFDFFVDVSIVKILESVARKGRENDATHADSVSIYSYINEHNEVRIGIGMMEVDQNTEFPFFAIVNTKVYLDFSDQAKEILRGATLTLSDRGVTIIDTQ